MFLFPNGPRFPPSSLRLFFWFAVTAALAVTAADFRLHWDEPAALFTASHLDFGGIAAERYQPTGIAGFYSARLAHLLWVKLLTTGNAGLPGLAAVIGSYAIALVLSLFGIHRLLTGLCPAANRKNADIAVAVTALAPVFVYLLGKTLPEAPALLAAVIACLGVLAAARPRAGRGALAGWVLLIACCLLVIVFSKNILVLTYAALVPTLLLFPQPHVHRGRLVAVACLSGLLALLFFTAVLNWSKIPLALYLGLFGAVAAEQEPLVSKILNVSMEAGLLFCALPLSLFSRRRQEAYFFLCWFALTTLPQILLLQSVESRYLLPNLPPLAGLVWLSLDWICRWWQEKPRRFFRIRSSIAALAALTVLAVLAVLASQAQRIMPHEVRMDQMHEVVRWLKSQPGKVAVLCPWEYTDFHYLRFSYPELPVYTVFSPELAPEEFANFNQTSRAAFLKGQILRNRDDLNALGGRKLFYVGFHESFPVNELRDMTAWLPSSWRQGRPSWTGCPSSIRRA